MRNILKGFILTGIMVWGVYQTLEAKNKSSLADTFSLVSKSKVNIYGNSSSQNYLFLVNNNHQFIAFCNSAFSDSLYLLNWEETGKDKFKVERPPLKWDRVAKEIVVGGLSGFVAAAGLGALFATVQKGWDSLSYAALGFLIGWPTGNAVGVYLTGTRGNETGSFLAALLGGIIGLVGPVIIIPQNWFDREEAPFAYAVFIASALSGPTIAFNMTRRYKTKSAPVNALVDFTNGKLRVNFPAISLQPSFYAKGNFSLRANLAVIEF